MFGSGGGADRYLIAGWSRAETRGRWTDGHEATIRFGLPRLQPGEAAVIEITAHGFVPDHAARTRVTVVANNEPIARWRFGPEASPPAHAIIPRDAVGSDGAVTLDLLVANPRQPSDYGAAPDPRDLGLYVEAITLTAVRRP